MSIKRILCGIAAFALVLSDDAVFGNSADHGFGIAASAATENENQPIETFSSDCHIYQLFDGGLTWSEAKEACEKLGGHLATITSAEEQRSIEDHLGEPICNNYWIGGYRDGDSWKWITDESFEYTNWESGEPNNYGGSENYVHMFGDGYKTRGRWNDASDSGAAYANSYYDLDKYGYICEFDPINPDVTYTPGNSCANLEWNAVSNAEKYAVYGYVDGKWTKFSETTDTSYTVKGLTAGKEYKVAVVAMFGGEWYSDLSKAIIVTPNPPVVVYPKVSDININSQSHRAKIDWEGVPDAEKYGVAVLINGKWKVQSYTDADTTTFTTPKLKTDTVYTLVICAKVNGKWETGKINERAFRLIAL